MRESPRGPYCGAVVEQEHQTHARKRAHLEGMVTCKECHALNVHGAHYCSECRAVLGSSPPLEHDEDAAEARRLAASELRDGYKTIGRVTFLYRLGAVAYAVVLFVAILALARTDVPRQAGIWVVGLSTLLTVLMLMGAMHVLFKPFIWTLVIASLASVVSIVHLVGPNPLGLMFFWSAGWSALLWAALRPTLRFQGLVEQYTDQYVMHHASARTRRSLQGRSAKATHERLLAVMRRAGIQAWRTSALAAAVVCFVSVLGTTAVLSGLRPADQGAALREFERVWNEQDVAAVQAQFAPGARQLKSAWLAGMIAGHGWSESLPVLLPGTVEGDDGNASVVYDAGGLELRASWLRNGRSWVLVDLELPEPPLEPVFDQFLVHWRKSRIRDVVSFFPPEHQQRMFEYLTRAAERRGWDSLPEVVRVERSTDDKGAVVMTMYVASSDVTAKWRFGDDGAWGLIALQCSKL